MLCFNKLTGEHNGLKEKILQYNKETISSV